MNSIAQQSWLNIKNAVQRLADGTERGYRRAEQHLLAANSAHGPARCTGQLVSRDFTPILTFCNRYECWKCGSLRIFQDTERVSAGLISADLIDLGTWYFCTLTDADPGRLHDDDAKLDFQANIKSLLHKWRIAATRAGHDFRRVAFYGVKSSGQLHCHVLASWLPDAVFSHLRSNYRVYRSTWLSAQCDAIQVHCHIQRVNDEHVSGYIRPNIESTLFEMPKNTVRCSFSRSWPSRQEAQQMTYDVAVCKCGQYAVVDGEKAPTKCKCGRPDFGPSKTKWLSAVQLPGNDMLLLKTQTNTNRPQETTSSPDVTTVTKTCSKCAQERPLTAQYFCRDRTKSDGYDSQCKKCRRAVDKERVYRQCQKRACDANRNAVRNASDGHTAHLLTTQDILDAYRENNGLCSYCSADLTNTSWHVDHWQPLSRAGRNVRSNIRAVCARCNTRKHDMTPDQWTSYLASVGIVTDHTPDGMPVQRQLLGRTMTMINK